MTEPKPLASLSSSLLARKGQAKPAMRPQGFAGFGMASAAAAYEDLGWNDMGTEPAPVTAEIVHIHGATDITPELSAVHRQQEELERELAPEPGPAPAPTSALTPALAAKKIVRAAPGSKARAAFTLRLDPERHLQLRLICAVQHRSAQQVVIDALDTFLSTQPAAATLATPKSASQR